MSFGNTYTLQHWLNFKSDDTGMVQIDEPIGFDAANFVSQQEKGRYGRDVSFAGGNSDFKFSPQPGLYPSPFETLIRYVREYGYEGQIDYILRENGTDYVVGQLDLYTANNDQIHEFSCTIIQDTDQAQIKRRKDVKVDLFSDESLDGDAITPVNTENILLKAKPVIKQSVWNCPSEFLFLDTGFPEFGFNHMFGILESGIGGTLSWISDLNTSAEDIALIEAQANLTNISMEISNLNIVLSSGAELELFYRVGGAYATATETLLDTFTTSPNGYTQTYSLPNISIGERLWVYFKFINGTVATLAAFRSGITTITTKSTAIDSVTKGIRIVDAKKQVAKSINNFTIDAPRFDSGGEFYDNFVFNGNLIRNRVDEDGNDVPFVMSWKDIMGWMPEVNADYQMNDGEVFCGIYDDFYANTEIGSFLLSPDATFNIKFNERYAINRFVFKYSKFNQDKDDENTIDGVHTEAEWLAANKNVENVKDVNVKFIRDPFMLETTREKSVSTKGTTSLSQDDQVFIFDCVPLAPGTTRGFSDQLVHYVDDDGNLQLLNSGFYNWGLLGFNPGASFTILDTDNAGDYTVAATTPSIITLTPIGVPIVQLDSILTNVEYPLTNVNWTLRTNEGFDIVENILGPDSFANLKYTPKRNIYNYWDSYLNTAVRYNQVDLKNTYFKNGGTLRSREIGQEDYTENDPILVKLLSDPLLTPRIIETKVLCSLETYRAFKSKIKSDRGFIRVYDNQNRVVKGYPVSVDYTLATEELTLEVEEKWESEVTTITYANNIYTINEVGYDPDIVSELNFTTEGEYIQFFDAITRPLTNPIRYNFVNLNGTIYGSLENLVIALNGL